MCTSATEDDPVTAPAINSIYRGVSRCIRFLKAPRSLRRINFFRRFDNGDVVVSSVSFPPFGGQRTAAVSSRGSRGRGRGTRKRRRADRVEEIRRGKIREREKEEDKWDTEMRERKKRNEQKGHSEEKYKKGARRRRGAERKREETIGERRKGRGI